MERLWLFLLMVAPALMVAGCESRATAARRAEMAQADLPVMCKAGPDCDEKWKRAGQWVTQHSDLPILTQSDTLIQTAKPGGLDKRAAITVSRTPASDDIYAITFDITCNNWFGCTPTRLESRAGFVDFVTASASDIAAQRLGVKVHPISAATAQSRGIESRNGVVAVVYVKPKSIADKAGLRSGDLIVLYDGKPVATSEELQTLVASSPSDLPVHMSIYRDHTMQDVKVRLKG